MQIGDTLEIHGTVTTDNTAEALGSGGLPVFGTPQLVAMMETAAFTLIQRDLPDGKSSVGVLVNIEHVSPSPIGMELRVTAEVTHISENGKMIDFKVAGFDASGLIGEGTHRRAIIDTERFMAKCQSKLEQ